MMSSYNYFADYYDILTSNIPYEIRGEYFNAILNKNGITSGILVDLACGTGSLAEIMAKKGFDVIGIDLSEEMLSIALEKKMESKLDILYLCQDMRNLDLFGTIDACICSLDSINHLTDKSDVENVFKKVSMFLNPNGIFIFDVNSIYKHQKVLSNQTFVYDYDDVYCVWQNGICDENNTVDISLDIFGKLDEDDIYERYSEQFSERAYSDNDIKKFIDAANLELVAVYEGDTFKLPQENSERLIYVTKSKKKI